MGIAFRVDEPKGVNVSAWVGEVTLDEAMGHLASVAATPGWAASRRILTDLSGVSGRALPSREHVSHLAAALVAQLPGRAPAAKWAIVGSAAFSRALQFSNEIGDDPDRRVLVFLDLASACIWLGVDMDRVRPVIDVLRHEACSA
jgi:hypothetical protein